MLNWQRLQNPLRRNLPGQNTDVVKTELHRFVTIKVVTGNLDNVKDLATTGSVDEAFHLLLLNLFFVMQIMKVLDQPGRVLSHVPAERDDHGDCVRLYLSHYKKWFGAPPADVWPPHFLQAKRKAAAQSPGKQKTQRIAEIVTLFIKMLTGKTITINFSSPQEATVLGFG